MGSKFLTRFFSNGFPNTETHHGGPYARVFNVLGNMCMANVLPAPLVEKLYVRLISRIVSRSRADFYIDANAYLAGLVPCLDKAYPNLRIVHLVRDPRDVVRSYINWIHLRPKSRFAHYLIPFWQPRSANRSPRNLKKKIVPKIFDRLAWTWTIKNAKFKELSKLEGAYRCVRFEDLFADSGENEEFIRLIEFMGLAVQEVSWTMRNDKINQTVERKFPHWSQWKPELCARLSFICGHPMQAYGYGAEQEWLDKVKAAVCLEA